jgi:DNA (cytosine-5)-methyltransferase 1
MSDMSDEKEFLPTFIEVCAGAGGLSCGLIKAGFKPLLLNDMDKNCCETLRVNHPSLTNEQIKCCSLKDLDLTSYIGQVDLLTGGVPCQSFSQAGKRGGLDDERGGLMLSFIEMVNKVKPKIFMIENVKGLMTHENGETFQTILNTFDQSQYDITYKLLNSVKHNVPQKRERVIIIGLLKSQNISFEFPPENNIIKTVGQALANVPPSPGAKYSDEKIELFKKIPQGGCWVNLDEDLQKQYLGKSFFSGGGKRGILHRLSLDKPSLTLLCSPSQKQTERCHPTEERPLTIREYARIQTFDDDYIFKGSMSAQYKQIGNAVPVEMARQIGVQLIEALKPH